MPRLLCFPFYPRGVFSQSFAMRTLEREAVFKKEDDASKTEGPSSWITRFLTRVGPSNALVSVQLGSPFVYSLSKLKLLF